MTIEITAVTFKPHGEIILEAIDCSEEHLQRMERVRDDCLERTLNFVFDTRDPRAYSYLNHWLHSQKRVKTLKPETYGAALQAVIGTVTTISGKYLGSAD